MALRMMTTRALESLDLAQRALRGWSRRRITVALLSAAAVALLVGIATVLIPNTFFTRDIPPLWWNYPVWLLTSLLTGVLIATYISDGDDHSTEEETPAQAARGRGGLVGGVLAWFAVGCPVCNKIALLALGYTGALTWFAPFQPLLAVVALALCGFAAVRRLEGMVACPVPRTSSTVAS